MAYARKLYGFALVSLMTMLASGTASQAQDSNFGLGLGVYSERRAYGDTVTTAVPLIDYDSTWFRLNGATADLKLPWISTDTLGFSVRARYGIGEGYEASDADILTGMEERERSIWLGGALEWNASFADFTLEAVADASEHSDGHRVRLEAARTFRWDRFSLTPRIVGTWMNDDTVDYYYGVRAGEATLDRPAYEGTSTTNVTVGLRAAYAPAANHLIVFDASVTRVGDSIDDSPITTEDTVTSVGLGYMYRF